VWLAHEARPQTLAPTILAYATAQLARMAETHARPALLEDGEDDAVMFGCF
jgi:hypothetical protein